MKFVLVFFVINAVTQLALKQFQPQEEEANITKVEELGHRRDYTNDESDFDNRESFSDDSDIDYAHKPTYHGSMPSITEIKVLYCTS